MGSGTASMKTSSLCLAAAVFAMTAFPTLAHATWSCIYNLEPDEMDNSVRAGRLLPPDDRYIKICPGFSGPTAPLVCSIKALCFDNMRPDAGNTPGIANCVVSRADPHCPLNAWDCVSTPGCPPPPAPTPQGLKPTSFKASPADVDRMAKALRQAR